MMAAALAAALLAGTAAAGWEEIDPLARAYYMRGSFMEARRDLVPAYTFYTQAQHFEPGHPGIQLALARVTYDLGKLDAARLHVQALIESGYSEGKARLILAEIEHREGRRDRAIDQLRRIKDSPDVPQFEVYKFLARIHLEQEDAPQARVALEAARDLDPYDLFVNYRLGFIYAESGDLERAAEAFRASIESAPGFASAHLALGSVLLHSGDREGGKRALREALALEPGNRNALHDLAELYLADREYAAGVELLEPLYIQRRLDESGRLMLGRFYYALGRGDDALEVFRAILAVHGEKPSLMRVIAQIEIDRGNFRTAFGYLQRLVRIAPDDFDNYTGILLLIGGLAGEPSGPDQAVSFTPEEETRYLREAAGRMNLASGADNFFIGAVYRKIGDYRRAERFLLSAEKISPHDRRTLIEIAVVFEKKGRLDEAIERISLLHEHDPNDPVLCNFYGYLLAEKGERLDFAERLVETALEADPGNGYYLDSLGWIKYRQGDYVQAKKLLQTALEAAGDDAVIWEHLGDVYVKLDMLESARASYARSIEIDPDRSEVGEKLQAAEKALSGIENAVE